MSLDFELYTNHKQDLCEPITSSSFIINIDGPIFVDDVSIPASHLSVISKRRILYRIHLEGSASSSDQHMVDKWFTDIIIKSKGILIDLQTERYESTSKSGDLLGSEVQSNEAASRPIAYTLINRFITAAKTICIQNSSLKTGTYRNRVKSAQPVTQAAPPRRSGKMVFYFEDGEGFYENGFEEMLEAISHIMPEAMPYRYGYYEPLQNRIEGGNVSELINAFKNEPKIFMDCRAPFGSIFPSVPCKKHFEKYHSEHHLRSYFLLGTVSFEFRNDLLRQPSRLKRLNRLFEHLCVSFDVVYAEISEGGHSDSWVWRGVPDEQTHTICLGEKYQTVWPNFSAKAYPVGNHHLAIATDRLGNKPPLPPNELVAPYQPDIFQSGPVYAKVFPFNYTYDSNKQIW